MVRSLNIFVFLLAALAAPLTSFAGNDTNYTYLALGDSITFGFNPTLLTIPPPAPSVFVGYPELMAQAENLANSKKEVNAACPGETSGSFINTSVPDNGCHSSGPEGEPPFKTWAGLHTNYPGAQLDFAVSQLSSNKHINQVTLQIGGNDVLLLLASCLNNPNPPACLNAGMPAVLQNFAVNLTQILTGLRSVYSGNLALVGYYAPSAELAPVAVALDQVMQGVGAQFGVIYVDEFSAFQAAAAPWGGDPCAAGLVVRLSATSCDVHPTLAGQTVLAQTIMATVGYPKGH